MTNKGFGQTGFARPGFVVVLSFVYFFIAAPGLLILAKIFPNIGSKFTFCFLGFSIYIYIHQIIESDQAMVLKNIHVLKCG